MHPSLITQEKQDKRVSKIWKKEYVQNQSISIDSHNHSYLMMTTEMGERFITMTFQSNPEFLA